MYIKVGTHIYCGHVFVEYVYVIEQSGKVNIIIGVAMMHDF